MNEMWEQIQLNTMINLKYYLRNRLMIVVIIIICFFFSMGFIPMLFFTSQLEKLQIMIMFFNQVNGLLKYLLGLIALFTVYHHISIKCLKVVFTKPCLPEYWLLSHFISPVLISAGMYSGTLIVSLLLAVAWALPVKAVIALLILTEFFKSLIIISCCTFLGILVHPVLAAFLLLITTVLTFARMMVGGALKSVKSVIGQWVLKIVKMVFDAINYILPSFSPYENELGKAYYTFKLAVENYPYIALVIGYSLVVSALFYFASVYLLKKKKYLYV